MGDFLMPSLGADMEHGTILEWRVQPGDHVQRGDIVALVETDKADIEVEVFESGVIEELLVPIGQKVPVGTPLARVGAGDRVVLPAGAPLAPAPVAAPAVEPVAVPAVEPVAAPAVEPLAVPADVGPAVVASAGQPEAPTFSPLVRHLAEDLHVDLLAVRGSGAGGAVTRRDVERAARPAGRPRVSPRARRLARQCGIDPSTITGSGPGSAVVGADVAAAVAAASAAVTAPAPTPPKAAKAKGKTAAEQAREAERARAMRRAIGNLMARSAREIPHYYLTLDIDLSRALTWLAEENAVRPMAERVLPAAMLLRATALAAVDVPTMNGFWLDDDFVPGDGVHLGVAVALRTGGLVTPAISNAHQLPLVEVMAALRDLVTRARTGRLKASELTGGTITVTNLGDLGADSVHGVIYPPQVALVGFGRVRERPWAEAGMLGVRPVVTATVAADHRASDGMIGARFLDALAKHLQQPEAL